MVGFFHVLFACGVGLFSVSLVGLGFSPEVTGSGSVKLHVRGYGEFRKFGSKGSLSKYLKDRGT